MRSLPLRRSKEIDMRHGIKMIALVAAVVSATMGTPRAWAKVRTETIDYTDGEAVLEGYLAWDDEVKGERPGVLVLHEWWGLNDYAKMRARQLAEMGYVAFAADIYGKGVRARTADEARRLSARFKGDHRLMRARVRAALWELKARELVDAKKVAAIGYCFGGTAALELARSGAKLRAVVSFHGGLDTPAPAVRGRIAPSVLVLHGGDDPHVPLDEVVGFQKEMREAKADWQMIIYGGAVHSFTNPKAGDDPSRGSAYNERAGRRAWDAMRLFLAETIGPRKDRPGVAAKIGRFTRDKIARPVGVAGKATGKAIKHAATWTAGKLTGKKDQDDDEDEEDDD